MKVLLVAHGYPPELVGGTERSVQRLAHALVADGVEVSVLAGSMDWERGWSLHKSSDRDPSTGSEIPVTRLHRADMYFDHWHKALCPKAIELFDAALDEIQPDVIHVHHWIRLSRDLIAHAARRGIPAVASLHDLWTTCLIAFRVRPDTEVLCDAPLAPSPCLGCAGSIPPRTPWVDGGTGRIWLAEHKSDLLRELKLARGLIAPSRSHASMIERMLGLEQGELEVVAIPPGIDVDYTRPEPPPLPSADTQLVIASWGHLAPVKGLHVALDALERLPDPSRVRFEIAGGDVSPEYRERLTRSAVGLDVHFHGAFDAAELDEHTVAKAHLMLSASLAHESWGMVVDEALALGLPCVLPDSGAYGERARGEPWARLFEPGDAESLARVIQELLRDPSQLAKMRAGVPRAAPRGWDVHASETSAIYERALRRELPQPPAAEWFAARMQSQRLADWDASLSKATGAELGFE